MGDYIALRQAEVGQEETFALPPGPAGIPEKAAIRQAGYDGRYCHESEVRWSLKQCASSMSHGNFRASHQKAIAGLGNYDKR